MTRNLVPLNAVRAFESAARNLSLLKAGKELSVSPAAITHHVKALEDFIGTPLFVRRHRSVVLTDAGADCLHALERSFQHIENTILRLRNAYSDGPLRVRIPPCVASKWLLPRLGGFQKANPDIEVQVSVSGQIFEFRFEEMDVMIRLRCGEFRGFVVEPIMYEHVMPVCSPDLLKQIGPIMKPADLLKLPLIHDDNLRVVETFPTWRSWFKAAGVEVADELPGHRFDFSPMAVEAAIDGLGVCLGRSAIIARDLQAGRIVRALDWTYPVHHQYFMIHSSSSVKARKIRRFRDWLLREAREAEPAAVAAPVPAKPLASGAPQRARSMETAVSEMSS